VAPQHTEVLAVPSARAPAPAGRPSILYEHPGDAPDGDPPAPDFFVDLNLDQVVESVTAGRQDYRLASFFHTPLTSVAAITYRHEVLRDLENPDRYRQVEAFAKRMRAMREQLTQTGKRYYARQQQRWFAEAVATYCDAVRDLARDLGDGELASRGFRAIRDYLDRYTHSAAFTALADETRGLLDDLATVRYCMHIKGNRIRVTAYHDESDYSADVLAIFAKFQQGDATDYRVKYSNYADLDHVEAAVLDLVAQLYPDVFGHLELFRGDRAGYLDATIARFDREVQFYTAYLDFLAPLRAAGLRFCPPQVSDEDKHIRAEDTFDLALAAKLVPEKKPVVGNEFHLDGRERVLVVSGPNQGGKTTFARTFGQLHYLASLGLPVPGSQARLWLYDRMFTHFEKEEAVTNLRGKLEDDLLRIHDILAAATDRSIVIMNESFTATTLHDAVYLGTKVLQDIIATDLLCVCVTFVDELTTLSDTTVSMVSEVDPDDPATRTFRVVRRPADGLSYAVVLARKHGLTYEALRRRIQP
jgi:DNA mismatch repair protein MutS